MTPTLYLGLSGAGMSNKATLGDSGESEDGALGMYGTLSVAAQTAVQQIKPVAGGASVAEVYGPTAGSGRGDYVWSTRPKNRL